MPPRAAREPREAITVPEEDTFCTISLEGHPEYTELIWEAIKAVAPVNIMIGRGGGQLQESRTPGLTGIRYVSLVAHKSNLPNR